MSNGSTFNLRELGSPDGSPYLVPGRKSSLLLEASAGTGKTYSLERIVLYLLLNPAHPLDIRQILMVTFTEAATQEIRERLRELLFSFIHEPDTRTELLSDIGLDGKVDFDAALETRLNRQLEQFSSVHIHTIHGFCKWILSTYALEAGLPRTFDLDQDTMEDAVRDYLRERIIPDQDWVFQGQPASIRIADPAEKTALLECLIRLLGSSSGTGDSLAPALARLFSQGYLDPDLYSAPWEEVHQIWNDLLLPRLSTFTSMDADGPDHANPDWIDLCADLKAELPEIGGIPLDGMYGGKTKGGVPNGGSSKALMAFYRRVGALHLLEYLYADFQHFVKNRPDFQARLSFDDLINRVHHLICRSGSTGSQTIKEAAAQEFHAVLLDEFQDTDRRQWEIFHTLFSSRTLMAVGDPKQSIYTFRGADLGTYLEAKASFAQTRSLEKNFRSSAALQDCINQIFTHSFQVCRTHVLDISYPTVGAGRKPEAGPWVFDQAGTVLPPVGILSPAISSINVSISSKRFRIYRMVSDEIRRLKDASLQLHTGVDEDGNAKTRALELEDICILCESFKDAGNVRDQLIQAGIPASIRGRGDLRSSQEARELESWLQAVQNPRDKGAVNAFLLGRFCGIPAREIQDFTRSPAMEDLRTRLFAWQAELPFRGLLPLFQELVQGAHLAGRDTWLRLLAAQGDSALRSITNYRHLAELFQTWLDENPQGLIHPGTAFSRFRSQLSTQDETPLRLDRDKGSVSIMTQHASKGLEFPVVFALVGLKNASGNGNKGFSFDIYDEKIRMPGKDEYHRRIQPYALPDAAKAAYKKRIKERGTHERLRLYYVAATRAQALLYLPFISWTEKLPGKRMLIEEWCSAIPEEGAPQPEAIFKFPDTPAFRRISDTPPAPTAAPGTPAPGTASPAAPAAKLPGAAETCASLLAARPPIPAQAVQSQETGSYSTWKKRLHPESAADSASARSGGDSNRGGADESETTDISIPPDLEAGSMLDLAKPSSQAEPANPSSGAVTGPKIPGGKDWGLAFHDVIAELDFRAFMDAWKQNQDFESIPEITRLVINSLNRHGQNKGDLIPKGKDRIQDHRLCAEINHVLTAPLHGLGACLDQLCREPSWREHREIEFHARIPRSGRLRESLQNLLGSGIQDKAEIHLAPGYLNGIMDMIFQDSCGQWHIIDWKTNTPQDTAVTPELTCSTMMDNEGYNLQALIYHAILQLILKASGSPAKVASVQYLFSRVGLDSSLSGALPDKPAPWAFLASSLSEPALESFILESGIEICRKPERI